ncbi:NAD-dependent dehydratase [candidate division WOR-3 bacterium JGI_Cruoil_03_51_56]|uniref:NAD-dependent dehydratase n=1 Tax=candidate division WOR-3 bacterium JGI_Cruoil_03_51_56 TaxID=1973747 RepID=A0A235BUJ7_UNCW3|nr:MAG: NAD-dependent dehydratase [candidate division WOR-3 bacterium JGI_Cruoil_03_51_56]
MKAIVAGGAGFIGSHLCEFLLKQNFQVICLDNLITGRKHNISGFNAGKRFEFVRTDISRHASIPGRVDVIFNLASPASPKDYLANPLKTLQVGAAGTRNLLDLARKKKAVFVMASTSEVYGDPKVHPQRESYWGNVNPIGIRSVYDEAKRYSEALVMAFHRRFGIPTRIARIFNTYGPRMKLDDGRVVPNLIDQALNGKPLTIYGTGHQTRSFCYVSDMVEGLFRLAGCPDPMPVNLGNPQESTILEFARLIKRLTGSSSRLTFLPLPQDDPKRRRPAISRARKLLGWKPQVSLEDGLGRTIEWFRKNGHH